MATMDENGYALIVDRKKDIIVSGGENISSLKVEKALLAHPGIYEVAVIPVPDDRWGEVPKALVVMKPGVTATENEVLEFCRGRLTHYKCPRSVEFLEALPHTGTGKVLGFGLQGRAAIKPIMDKELASLKNVGGFNGVTLRSMGGTDHLSFEAAGVPGFACDQDMDEYRLTHHTQADTFDKAKEPKK